MNKGIWFLVLTVFLLMGFVFTVGYSFVDSNMIYIGIPLAFGVLCSFGIAYYLLEILPQREKEELERKSKVESRVLLPGKKLPIYYEGEV